MYAIRSYYDVKNKWNQAPELFDLAVDPGEQHDLLAHSPETAATLQALWNEWDKPNIPYQFLEFFQYESKRKAFHQEVVPPEARKARGTP